MSMYFEHTAKVGDSGAYYSSVKTQGDALFRKARYKDALVAYNEAFTLNPRSKTILLSKAKCHTQLGDIDEALRQTDQARSFGIDLKVQRKSFRAWSPKRNGRRQNQDTHGKDDSESPGDLTYKCRYLLSKADALYNKGDFEGALVFYHKGKKLRPHSDEFRMGILKSEEALQDLFQTKKPIKRRNEYGAAAGNMTFRSNTLKGKTTRQSTLASETKSEKGSGKARERKPEKGSEKAKETKSEKELDTHAVTPEKASSETNQEQSENKDTTKLSEKNEDTSAQEADVAKDLDKTENEGSTREGVRASQSERATLPTPEPPYHLDRKERIREMRLTYAIREREEARRTRAKMQMLTRPTVHLSDDQEFLKMLYKDFFTSGTRKEKRVRKVAKDALNYLDTRNKFWKQQTPHHLREKSTLVAKAINPAKTGPPPTQAMYKFVIKEMVRINNMLDRNQFHRTIDNAKKLIEHINNMDKSVPNKFNILANLFSMIGQAYLELGDSKKALAFHMKDLELSTQHDLDHAKSRALDNTGRVFARIGEFAKAIAVWEEKLVSPHPIPAAETAWLCHELGYCYIEIEDFGKAKESGEKALTAAKEAGEKRWQLNANTLIAQATLNMGEAVMARDAFDRALKLAVELKDDKAKESIEPALDELNKVLEQWEKDGENGNLQPTARSDEAQPESTSARKESSKTERSQSDWLLGDSKDDQGDHNQTKNSARVNNADTSESDAETKKKRVDYNEVYATYVGGKDSDFYITPSGESSGEDKTGKPDQQAPNEPKPETKTVTTSETKPPKPNQSSRANETRKPRAENNAMKREVSFSRSPGQSPSRGFKRESSFAGKPKRENSFAGKPRREHSFARAPRREKSNVSSKTDSRIPLTPQEMNPPPVTMRRERSQISLLESRKYRSTNDLSDSRINSRERRNSVTVGIGGTVS